MAINQGGKMERDQLSEPQNSEPIPEQPQSNFTAEDGIDTVQDTSLENFQVNINDGSVSSVNQTVETIAPEKTMSETLVPENSSSSIDHQENHDNIESNSAPVQQTEANVSVEAPSEKIMPVAETKHKGTAIIITIVAICVLGLAALATWFFVFYNNPTKIVTDSVSGLFSAENLSMQGDIYLEPIDTESSDINVKKVWVSFTSNNRKLSPSSHGGAINLELSDGDSLTLFFDYKIAKNHNIYIKLGALTEVLEMIGISREDYPEATTLFDFIEMLDDEWWEITTEDLTNYLGSNTFTNIYNGYIDCTNEYTTSIVRDKILSKIYQEHSFLSVSNNEVVTDNAEGGVRWLSVDINPDKAADFINQVTQSEVAKQYSQCLSDQLNTKYNDSSNTVKAADIKKNLPDDFQINLGVNSWTHQLKYLTNLSQNEYMKVNTKLEFRYQDMPYEDPESYRPISELISKYQDNADEVNSDFYLIMSDLNGLGDIDNEYDYLYEDYYEDDDYYYYDYFGEELEN